MDYNEFRAIYVFRHFINLCLFDFCLKYFDIYKLCKVKNIELMDTWNVVKLHPYLTSHSERKAKSACRYSSNHEQVTSCFEKPVFLLCVTHNLITQSVAHWHAVYLELKIKRESSNQVSLTFSCPSVPTYPLPSIKSQTPDFIFFMVDHRTRAFLLKMNHET